MPLEGRCAARSNRYAHEAEGSDGVIGATPFNFFARGVLPTREVQ